MEIEFEATFMDVDKDEMRQKLRDAGAELLREEFLQKRSVFHLPTGNEIAGGWCRVRDEDDKITMSMKIVSGDKIHDQKEVCLTVDSMQNAERFLQMLGCRKKAYQESKRELWMLDGVEVTIDEWPHLEPYVEVEGKSEEEVKAASAKLGFDYSTAVFGSVDVLYSKKYGIPIDRINNETPEIVFGGKNPFEKE